MEIVILDENQIELNKFDCRCIKNISSNKVDTIHEVSDETKGFIENLEGMVSVYSSVKNSENFYISFLNSAFKKYFSVDDKNIEGYLISDLFSFENNQEILTKLNEIYNSNQRRIYYLDIYNNTFEQRFKTIIFRKNDFLYVLHNDITEQIEKEHELRKSLKESLRLEQNFEKIQRISKTSMCYSSDKINDVVWFSRGYNVFGKDFEKYSDNIDNYLVEEDKDLWKEKQDKCTPENPEVSFIQRIVANNGDLRYIRNFVAYEFDKEGNKESHVNFFQDITDIIKREKKLRHTLDETLRLKNNLNRIQSVSKTAMGYSTKLDYSNWTLEVFDLLEINPSDYINNTNNLIERFVLDEDLEHRKQSIALLNPNNPDVEFTQRVKTGKGNIKYLRTVMHRDYDKKGNLLNIVSYNQDITHEVEYQNKLENALKDREILLSEVHHRIKNNLQIILSLISLNENYGEDSKSILQNTQDRIYSLALIHEKIYGSGSLSEVNMKDYIESLITSLLDLYDSDITFQSDIDSINLNMDESIPIGLIINELVNNTIKYAFPDHKKGNIIVKFKKESNNYTLTFEDNGIGLPENFDLESVTTLGLIVVTNLTLQIGGKISIMDCKGTGYKIEFERD